MGLLTKVTGRMICKKGKESRFGVMEQNTQVTIRKEKSIIMAYTNG